MKKIFFKILLTALILTVFIFAVGFKGAIGTDSVEISTFIFILIIFGVLALVITVCYLIKNIVVPIKEIAETTKKISLGHFDLDLNKIKNSSHTEINLLLGSLKRIMLKFDELVYKEKNFKEQLLIFTEILYTIRKTYDIEEAFILTSRRISEALRFDRVLISEYNPLLLKSDILTCYTDPHSKIDDIHPIDNSAIEDITREFEGTELLFLKYGKSPKKKKYPMFKKIPSAFIIPIYDFEDFSGILMLETLDNRRNFCMEEIVILDNITDVLSNLMKRKNIEKERDYFTANLEKMVDERTTKLKEMTLKSEEARQLAEKASSVKSQFLANVSHEIRTPMNAIIGLSELLLSDNLNDRQYIHVSDIKTSAVSLLYIINDILDLSKIEASKLHLVPVHYNLLMLLDTICSSIDISLTYKNISFNKQIMSDVPEFIFGDDLRLKQILINILNNAIKCTKEGSVKLTVYSSSNKLYFDIQDTGIGIREEDLLRIFKEFEKLEYTENIAVSGVGIGLSICKTLIGMMGGHIGVSSEYGKGSIFHIEIPYTPGDESKIASFYRTNEFIKAPTAKILLVDDNEINLAVCAGLLELCDIHAITAASGFEAIELLSKDTYDLVFMDHMMPEMDGVETTKKIRKLGTSYETLPIVALSANASADAKEMFLESGMNDFLAKPIDKIILMQILRKWLPSYKIEGRQTVSMEVDPTQMSSALINQLQDLQELNVDLGLSRVGYQEDVYKKSLSLFKDRMPVSMKQMSEHIENKAIQNFAIEVHGLKGSLANIGAMELSKKAFELENAAKLGNLEFCQDNYLDFYGELEKFSVKLGGILEKNNSNTLDSPYIKTKGNNEFLTSSLAVMKELIDNFETNMLKDLLEDLLKYSFDDTIDEQLIALEKAIDSFDLVTADAIINQLN